MWESAISTVTSSIARKWWSSTAFNEFATVASVSARATGVQQRLPVMLVSPSLVCEVREARP